MKSYQNNMADQDLIVHSLNVITDIKGGNIKEIKKSVEALKRQTVAQNKQQEEYWKVLSDDGIISTIEKQLLRREVENIARSFAAITAQATALGYTSEILEDFVDTYDALHDYLFVTLKLFDNMQEDTPIDDRDTFNAYFSNYYFEENFLLLAITAGILETVQIRVLDNLQEQGTEGETALYHGGLYQYTNGAWKNVSTGNYKGARTELPAAEEESFFIVSESFTVSDALYVNGEELYVNGEVLYITRVFNKGEIYYCQDGTWYAETDTRNWRYSAAFADVINITGELPQIFQDAIDDLQSQVDTITASLEDEIAAREGGYTIINGDLVQIGPYLNDLVARIDSDLGTKIDHLPEYYGGTSSIPQNPKEGDFFLYNGSNSGKWIKSIVYRYTNGSWFESDTSPYGLDPTVSANRDYYQMALQDVLACNVTTNGYYAAIFAQSFFGNDATLNSLETKVIYLRQGGNIRSYETGYVAETSGLNINADGDIDANGDTHIGGKVAIGVHLTGNSDFNNYDVVIGGNAKIDGTVNIGARGTINNAFADVDNAINNKADTSALDNYVDTDTYTEDMGDKVDNDTLTNNYSTKDIMAQKLGYDDWADLEEKVEELGGITENGFIRTGLIIADALWSEIVGAKHGIFENITVTGFFENNNFKVKQDAGDEKLLYGRAKSGMTEIALISIITSFLNNNISYTNTDKTIDITFENMELNIIRSNIPAPPTFITVRYEHITRIVLEYCTTDYSRAIISNDPYCIFTVYMKDGTSAKVINDEAGTLDWEQKTLGGTTSVAFNSTASDYGNIRINNLPQEDKGIDGQLYFDNGFLKVSGQKQPWKYFEFVEGTDYCYVYDIIKPFISNGLIVSAMGYYGTSDSSHTRCISAISAVSGNLRFFNLNETEYLYIPSNITYGQNHITQKLVVMFIS